MSVVIENNITLLGKLAQEGVILGVRCKLANGEVVDVINGNISFVLPTGLPTMKVFKRGDKLVTSDEIKEGKLIRDASEDETVLDALTALCFTR